MTFFALACEAAWPPRAPRRTPIIIIRARMRRKPAAETREALRNARAQKLVIGALQGAASRTRIATPGEPHLLVSSGSACTLLIIVQLERISHPRQRQPGFERTW